MVTYTTNSNTQEVGAGNSKFDATYTITTTTTIIVMTIITFSKDRFAWNF